MTQVSFEKKTTLIGHNGDVTSLAIAPTKADTLVSGSRDKTLIVWKVDTNAEAQPETIAPKKSLHGHSHFVSDVVLSNDGNFAISASWDHTLRLWDLNKTKNCINYSLFISEATSFFIIHLKIRSHLMNNE